MKLRKITKTKRLSEFQMKLMAGNLREKYNRYCAISYSAGAHSTRKNICPIFQIYIEKELFTVPTWLELQNLYEVKIKKETN